MTMLLDLNDASLTAWRQGECHASPGYVRYDGESYDYGLGAQAVARRFPRHISTRYWSQLNLQPLAPPLGPARHSADLVHGHLSQLLTGHDGSVILAVPGHLSREQLSLLLGVIGTLPVSVSALIHRSTAIAAATGASDCAHVELQLQQTLITPVRHTGDEWVADTSTAIPGKGWLWLLERIASVIAAQFVDQTRFDPQRSADSEQRLYDAIPDLLASLAAQSEARIEIDGYSARIRTEQLAPVGAAFSEELVKSAPSDLPLLLAPRIASLPGLSTSGTGSIVANMDWPVQLLAHAEALQQAPDQLRLQRRLSGQVTAALAETAEPGTTASAPTHFLTGHTARALADHTTIGRATRLSMTAGRVTIAGEPEETLKINGQSPTKDQLLEVGDTLTDSSGLNAELILVES